MRRGEEGWRGDGRMGRVMGGGLGVGVLLATVVQVSSFTSRVEGRGSKAWSCLYR